MVGFNTPASLPKRALKSRPRARAVSTTALPAVPAVVKQGPVRARPVPQRLSYSQISDYGKCGYRFYLRRMLQLPDVEPPPPDEEYEIPAMDPRTRGSIVHRLLEDLDFADPRTPEITDEELTEQQREDIRRLVDAFATSPLCGRLANARRVTREAGFQFTLEPDGSGPLVRGFVDVLAVEADGTHLVVDYKTDRIEDDPEEYVVRNYEVQRLVYALAALRDGAPRVEVAYCLLDHRPEEPIVASYSRSDAPELADAINRLATGILTHEYPVTPMPHRELCGDCPGRTALCSYGPEMTLRPPPALWPGAPARRRPPAGVSPAADPLLR
jgi:RecB family exonuclease